MTYTDYISTKGLADRSIEGDFEFSQALSKTLRLRMNNLKQLHNVTVILVFWNGMNSVRVINISSFRKKIASWRVDIPQQSLMGKMS